MGVFPGARTWIGQKSKGSKTLPSPKKSRLRVYQMVRSRWVYRQPRRCRAGIQGCIWMLKRVVGVGRCTWRGWAHFQQHVYLLITSFNLQVLARLLL